MNKTIDEMKIIEMSRIGERKRIASILYFYMLAICDENGEVVTSANEMAIDLRSTAKMIVEHLNFLCDEKIIEMVVNDKKIDKIKRSGSHKTHIKIIEFFDCHDSLIIKKANKRMKKAGLNFVKLENCEYWQLAKTGINDLVFDKRFKAKEAEEYSFEIARQYLNA